MMKIHWFFKVMSVFLALFLFWVFFYYGLPRVLPAQRIESQEVYGLIFADQVWGGNIKIVGDVYSVTNNKIIILPGTKIKVAIEGDKSNMDFLPWHRKGGVNAGSFYRGIAPGEPFWDETQKIQIHLNDVEVTGEPSNEVEISSDSQRPSPYDFNVLSIRSGVITNALFSSYRRFEIGKEVFIANSDFKETGECALCISWGSPQVHNNIFENNYKDSIFVERGSPKITNNLFQNLKGEGIKIDSKRLSSPQITNNVFEMPQGTALNIVSGGELKEGLVARNIFSGSSQIKIACDSKVKIKDNVILGSVSFYSGCGGGFTFGPNFWGTPDPSSVMNEKILNKYDKFRIEIPNILLSPPKEAGRQ
jgi:hypothetical protein